MYNINRAMKIQCNTSERVRRRRERERQIFFYPHNDRASVCESQCEAYDSRRTTDNERESHTVSRPSIGVRGSFPCCALHWVRRKEHRAPECFPREPRGKIRVRSLLSLRREPVFTPFVGSRRAALAFVRHIIDSVSGALNSFLSNSVQNDTCWFVFVLISFLTI